MLKLAQARHEVSIVDDQIGNSTSAIDIADAIMAVGQYLLASNERAARHLSYGRNGNWPGELGGFRRRDLQNLLGKWRTFGKGQLHPNQPYPTPALRPANSQLDWQDCIGATAQLCPIGGVR